MARPTSIPTATLTGPSPQLAMVRPRSSSSVTTDTRVRRHVQIPGSIAAAVLDTQAVLDAAEMHQFCRVIGGQADHMLELTTDFVAVARIKAGAPQISLKLIGPTILGDQPRNTFLSGGGRDTMHIVTLSQTFPR